MKLGRVFGIPVNLHWSFLLLLGIVALSYGGLAGVALLGIAFTSVLIHEFGHALVARRFGVYVDSINLYFFGGAAKMASTGDTPKQEAIIAAAGPAVSFVLAALGFALGEITTIAWFGLLGWVNVMIGGFNLLPVFPMDGGRILRSGLSTRLDNMRATRIAVWVGRVFALAAVALALVTNNLYLVLLAGVIWWMGTKELWFARMKAMGLVSKSGAINLGGFDPRQNQKQSEHPERIVFRDGEGNIVEVVERDDRFDHQPRQ